MGDPPVCGGKGLTTPLHERMACYEMLHRASDLMGSCEHSNEPLGSMWGISWLAE